MRFSSSKDINSVIQEKVKNGWVFKKGKKHGKLIHIATGRKLAVPSTPSDYRAMMNFSADVKRLLNNDLHIIG